MPISVVGKGVVGLVTLGVLGAYEISPPDIREQTVFLERIATRIEGVKQIPAETQKALSDILDRISGQPVKANRSSDIEARRQLAIAKIEDIMGRRTSSQ